jgi:hypothetical protein
MKPGYICVAGIEPGTGKHIRPVLNHGRLPRVLLRKEGGVFEIGALVDLGPTVEVGHAPEVEDHEFSTENVKYRHKLKAAEFWKYLTGTSQNELTAIFGNELQQRESSCTIDVDAGEASLGNLQPEAISYLGVNPWDKIRIRISDGEFHPDLSVTDIRLYRNGQQTPRRRIVDSVGSRLPKTRAILAVGLTRPWRKNGDTAQRHWLQVNNIHLEEDPLGETFEFQ